MIGKTISHYKILGKLGEGGMGVVYKAEDTKLKRTVALKFLAPQVIESEKDRVRFVLEAQAAAKLDHPNICTVHEIDEVGDQTFIAMAYVDGQSLEEKVQSGGVLNINEALNIAIQVAEGLGEAHKKGIVHRDIKSANIMVTEDGKAKIMDFGLAKLAGRTRLTKTATIMGTVAYMSPEQASGKVNIDRRTDIWSLGVVLYKMLTGYPPFDAPSDAALIHKIIYEEMKTVSALDSDIPSELEDVIQRMLRKNPQDRYQDMQALIADLQSIKSRRGSVTTKRSPSIAVLPFVNMSADPEQEYFCDGLAEELINSLTQLENLHVVARTSAFFFKGKDFKIRDIGRELNVETVLEGSVRRAGNRLRITAQLVKVDDGYHLWSEKYDRNMEDIFAVQDEISETIVDRLKPRLLGEPKSELRKRQAVDIEAYDLYLKGRYFWNRMTAEGLEKAIEFFNRTIQKAPDYALAHTGLADSYNYHSFYGLSFPREGFPKARAAALKALELDESLGEAHASLGILNMWDWDWHGAEKEFQHAIRLNPGYAEVHHWYGHLLSWSGRFEQGIEEMLRARELDPLSLMINRCLGMTFGEASEYDRAIEAYKKTIELDSTYPLAHYFLGCCYFEQGMHDEAMAEFKAEKANLKGKNPVVEADIGYSHVLAGRTDEARKMLNDLIDRSQSEHIPKSLIAGLFFGLQDVEKGFEWLQKACRDRDPHLVFLRVSHTYDLVRTDPRFIAILREVGLDK